MNVTIHTGDVLEAELIDAGVITAPLARSRVSRGALLARHSLTSAVDEHLVLDQPIEDVLAPAMTTDRLEELLGRAANATVAATPAHPAPGGWYHRTPWPAVMLADVLAATDPPPFDRAVCPALGEFLARLHAAPARTPLTVASPPLTRLRASRAHLTAGQWEWVRDVTAADGAVVPVHGQLATGHVFVPEPGLLAFPGADRTGRLTPTPIASTPIASTPIATVTGWTSGLVGCAGLDLGHFIGDLIELAVLLTPTAPDRSAALLAAVPATLGAYAASANRELDDAFWDRMHTGAVLKVLDHRARISRLPDPPAQPLLAADLIAADLADGRLAATLRKGRPQ
jgi:hypothetical protein